jgi:hypothetical protein
MATQPRLPEFKTTKRDISASGSIPVTVDKFMRAETEMGCQEYPRSFSL